MVSSSWCPWGANTAMRARGRSRRPQNGCIRPSRVLRYRPGGTDSVGYSNPLGQIQAFRPLQIALARRERYGYPQMMSAIRAKVVRGNALRQYHVPDAVPQPH